MRYQQQTRFPLPRRTTSPPPSRGCPNCGTPVSDLYCPRCGQRNKERLVSLRAIVQDAAEDQFSLGGALPRTLGALLFRPGRLTREYVEGRIARYIPPFRLYLVSSLVFFVVFSFVASFDRSWSSLGPSVQEEEETWSRRPDGTLVVRSREAQFRLGVDTAAVPGWLKPAARYYVAREDELNRMPSREGARVMYGALESNVPRALFLVVPLFALFLKGLYPRRLYVEHFVFVLHLHALGFLLATILSVAPGRPVAVALGLWFLVYLLLALRRVYARPWPWTAARYAVLLAAYALVGLLLVVGVGVAAVLTA
jgi:hypothetical protein